MRWLIAMSAVGTLAFVLTASAAPTALKASAAPTAASNQAAARADAASLLRSLLLPAGTVSSASEPAGDRGVLAQPAVEPGTPNLVDDYGFWIAPGSPGAVLRYIEAHPPAGTKRVLRGSGVSSLVTGYARPAIRGVLGERWLIVELTQLADGSTGVRADAEVVWITPRPASERLPSGAGRLVLSVRKFGRVIQARVRITARWRIARVVRLINGLPLKQPGAVPCPADFGSLIRLAFYEHGRRAPLAVVRIDPSGCGQVGLTVRGRRQPELASSSSPRSLVAQLERALGVRIRTGLPSPPRAAADKL